MARLTALIALLIIGFSSGTVGQERNDLTVDEIKEIIRLAIDLPELQDLYHVDVDKSRIPLTFQTFGTINSENLKGIEKFGKPLRVLHRDVLEKEGIKAFLTIGDWTHIGDKLRLQLGYSIEGVTANYMFQKTDDKWAIVNFEIWEN